MITVSKDAIKYRDSNGQMQNADIMCQVSALNDQWIDYAQAYNFRSSVLPENSHISIKPKVALNTNMSSWFREVRNLKTLMIDYDFSDKTYTTNFLFSGSINLEIVDFKNKVVLLSGNCTNTFNNCENLTEIKAILNLSEVTSVNTMFNLCKKLKEVRFNEGSVKISISFASSNLLSAESIQSIIDGLADLTGVTAQTLTFHTDVKNKLTQEQLTTITNKNWTLA